MTRRRPALPSGGLRWNQRGTSHIEPTSSSDDRTRNLNAVYSCPESDRDLGLRVLEERAAEVVVLLRSFGLLPAAEAAGVSGVKRRYSLDARGLEGRLSELGTLVRLLRSTFDSL